MLKIFNSILRSSTHFAFASFLFTLPMGYYYENSDSTDVVLGFHGGKGQVATVIRGCDGGVIDSEGSKFTETCGSAYLSVPPGVRSPLIIGIRGGKWESNARFANRSSTIKNEKKIRLDYYNPNISIETKYYGFGIGYISGNIKHELSNYRSNDDNSDKVKISWHCRFGNVEKGYLAFSYAENTPLISGGGLFDIGVGYKVSKSIHMFTGLGAGFYDGTGFLQQIRVKPTSNLSLDFACRLGSSAGKSESAFSGGIVYQVGFFK